MMSVLGKKLAKILGERGDYGIVASHRPYETLAQHRIHEFLPYERYDPETELFFNENSTGFVLETFPLVGCTEEMQREISGLFIHTLPENSYFQCMLFSHNKIGNILDYWARPRHAYSEVLSYMAKERCAFLEGICSPKGTDQKNSQGGTSQNDSVQSDSVQSDSAQSDSALIVRDMQCFLSFSVQGSVTNPLEQEKIIRLKNQITTSLKGLGLPVFPWKASDLLEFLDNILLSSSETRPSKMRWNPFDSLSSQLSTAGKSVRVTADALFLSEETCLKTYSVKSSPKGWSLGAMSELIGDPFRDYLRIPCPFYIHYGIEIPKQSSIQNAFGVKESWVNQQAQFGNLRKRIPQLNDEAEDVDFVRRMLSQGHRMVRSNLSVTLICPKSRVDHAEQSLLNLYRSKEWELSPDRLDQFPAFLSTLPMTWGDGVVDALKFTHRLKTTVTSESANLLPIQGEWKGTLSPGMLLVGRRGQPMMWSPFDNNAGNYNVSVVGRSGSGKSVFMQELMSCTLGIGGKVFVLDVGRSFEKTCGILGGQFMEFTSRSNLCLNPFTHLKGLDEDALNDAWGMIKPILGLMAAPTKGTDDRENAALEKAMHDAWGEMNSKTTITDVARQLMNSNDPIAIDLGKMLYPYTKEGIYGGFFEGDANVNFSNPLVVIEFEELKDRKDLQAVIVQMVIMQITKQMFLGDRKTPTMIVFDEAWDLLRGAQSGVFIETLARRVRKYKGSLVVGTQSVNDFFQSSAAQAAFENSDWMCLLSQKKESIEMLRQQSRICMDDYMESLLSSVKTKQGEYAEAMIYGSHGYAVGRLLLDPFSQILYSTKPEEYAAVKTLQAQGFSLVEAVGQVSGRDVKSLPKEGVRHVA